MADVRHSCVGWGKVFSVTWFTSELTSLRNITIFCHFFTETLADLISGEIARHSALAQDKAETRWSLLACGSTSSSQA